MNSVSKVKIVVGYTLLLAAMFFSLFFVHREMENLMHSEDRDGQWTDSLLTLLREKDTNTIRMLRTLSEANESMVSTSDIENIIAEQDSIVTQQRVQHRIISHRDTIVTSPKKKGFFRRLGEVFAPSKKDTAIQVKTSLEFATDTVLEAYNPADSLHEKLRAIAKQKKEGNSIVQRRKRNLQRLDHMLTARIDSLLKDYEEETMARALAEAEKQQTVRHRSAKIIGGIAVGAVLLSAFFLIIIGRDITRSNRYRRDLEEARRRAEDLLVSREKLMLAITHDFKAPLGSIMGYADLLSRLTVDERQRFYLDNMKTSSEHLLKLVVDLLDFHRLDLQKAEINRVTFHPADLLEEVYVSFGPLAAAKGLYLKHEIAPELQGTFISDPLRLRQIINNLLSNAVKFTSQGGITLKATYVERGSASFNSSHLLLTVTDTGKGMGVDDRERIFQEFTRLPGAQGEEGFGLGLSIVRMLVQLLEGKIEVDSVLGKGSTFTLRLPLYPVKNEELRMKDEESPCGVNVQPNSSISIPYSSLNKLLLIDDDRIQLTLTAAMLQQSGIDSVICQQPDELLEALRTDTFDLLLTDVQMPAMNGFDLLSLLRASNITQAKTIPVIAVTARSDMQREDFLSHGFAGSLHKPFTVNELLAELNLEQRAVVSQPTDHALNFSALTAFSGDDPDAAKSILESFVQETRLNADRLRQALDSEDIHGIAALGHKMLPLFTLLGAAELVDLLKELEASREASFNEGIKNKTLSALALIDAIVEQVVTQNISS